MSTFQWYTTVLGDDVLVQASTAKIVKVRVVKQPAVESECETMTVGVPELSVTVVAAVTLSSVGRVAELGLQPRSPPGGVLVMTGGEVSTLTVTVVEQVAVQSPGSETETVM